MLQVSPSLFVKKGYGALARIRMTVGMRSDTAVILTTSRLICSVPFRESPPPLPRGRFSLRVIRESLCAPSGRWGRCEMVSGI